MMNSCRRRNLFSDAVANPSLENAREKEDGAWPITAGSASRTMAQEKEIELGASCKNGKPERDRKCRPKYGICF